MAERGPQPPLPQLSLRQRYTLPVRLWAWQQKMLVAVEEWKIPPGAAVFWVDGSLSSDGWAGCAWVTRKESGDYEGQAYALGGSVPDSHATELRAVSTCLDHIVGSLKSGSFTPGYVAIWSDCMDSLVEITRCWWEHKAGLPWEYLVEIPHQNIVREILERLRQLETNHAVEWGLAWRKRDDGFGMRKADELASSGSRLSRRAPIRVKPGEVRKLGLVRIVDEAAL